LQRKRRRSFSEFPKEPHRPEFLCAAEDPGEKRQNVQLGLLSGIMEEKKIQGKKAAVDLD